MVQEIKARALYVEAGGYHNGVIVKDNNDTKVFVWGRGDVGQLGVTKEHFV